MPLPPLADDGLGSGVPGGGGPADPLAEPSDAEGLGDGASTAIHFANPEYGVAPGQAAVLYAGDRVIGGGWIAATN